MLFTRCPHCETTFRITSEALDKASGQVRCGRCTNVFDATRTLSETLPVDGAAEPRAARDPSPTAPPAGGADPAATVLADAVDAPADAATESAANASTAPEAGPGATPVVWRIEPEAPTRSAAWAVAAVLASIALAAQLVHAFRSELVRQTGIGPLLDTAYATLGMPIVPDWNVGQYRIVNWVATASPGAADNASLVIRAEIANDGPDPHPYPHVSLELKDRWDAVVGRRVFAPDEYLRESARSRMRAGERVVAELDVVDPGPDAYGFEIDVCVRTGSKRLHCATDDVFR